MAKKRSDKLRVGNGSRQAEESKQPASYFLSLKLANVRCFSEEQTLDLSDGHGRPARWTILLGENGTGKTTILQVLVVPELMSDYSTERRNPPGPWPRALASGEYYDTYKKMSRYKDGAGMSAEPSFVSGPSLADGGKAPTGRSASVHIAAGSIGFSGSTD